MAVVLKLCAREDKVSIIVKKKSQNLNEKVSNIDFVSLRVAEPELSRAQFLRLGPRPHHKPRPHARATPTHSRPIPQPASSHLRRLRTRPLVARFLRHAGSSPRRARACAERECSEFFQSLSPAVLKMVALPRLGPELPAVPVFRLPHTAPEHRRYR